jgi:hypothetical protein
MANGVDFGSASRLSLPKLNVVEEYLISRSSVSVSLIKLNIGDRRASNCQTGSRHSLPPSDHSIWPIKFPRS